MAVKLEGVKGRYNPKDSDEVRCETHGVVTVWGALDQIQRMACEEGLDTTADLPCLLLPKVSDPISEDEAEAFVAMLSQKPRRS
jgi:hypothetical protein